MYLFWMDWEDMASPNGIFQIHLACPTDERIHSFFFYDAIWQNLILHMINILISALKTVQIVPEVWTLPYKEIDSLVFWLFYFFLSSYKDFFCGQKPVW